MSATSHTKYHIIICTNKGVPRNSVTYSSDTIRISHASARISALAFSKRIIRIIEPNSPKTVPQSTETVVMPSAISAPFRNM